MSAPPPEEPRHDAAPGGPPEPGVRGREARVVTLAAACFVLAYVTMAWSAVSQQSNAFDELLHLAGGYSYGTFGDYRIHPENGNLPQRLFALRLLGDDAIGFPSAESPAWRQSRQWTVAHRFAFSEGNDVRDLLARGRSVAVWIGASLIVLVGAWSARLFGVRAALLSMALACFSPTLLAHGPLLTSDATMALLLPASVAAFWWALHRAAPGPWLASAVLAGLLFVTKFSAPLLVPVAALLAGLRVAAGRPWAVRLAGREGALGSRSSQAVAVLALGALHAVAIFALIWAFYGFRFEAMADPAPDERLFDAWEVLLGNDAPLTNLLASAKQGRWLPEAFLYGVAFVDLHTQQRFAFLAGEFGIHGWASFFPIAFAIKTPLALFALLGLAAFAPRPATPPGRPGLLYRAAPLFVLIAVYWAASLPANVNIGVRHLLPTYPLLFVLAGPAAGWLDRTRPLATGVVGLALAAFVAASLSIRPHYLSYFNVLVGPEQGYRWLVDSSLDWGQDLPTLAAWLEAEAPEGPVYLSYFGSSSPEAFGVRARQLPSYHDWPEARGSRPFALRPGTYVLSATMLQAVYTTPPGPWTEAMETRYVAVRDRVAPVFALSVAPVERRAWLATAEGRALYAEYHALRFGRLAAFLRRREPDDRAGYGLLVYRLGRDDLAQALYGPPPERAPEILPLVTPGDLAK